jgi:hypothetical protein
LYDYEPGIAVALGILVEEFLALVTVRYAHGIEFGLDVAILIRQPMKTRDLKAGRQLVTGSALVLSLAPEKAHSASSDIPVLHTYE